MKMDVIGRVRNVQLPVSKPLMPVFEAIMNSIQSIDDGKGLNGRIDIEVLRDSNSTLLPDERAVSDIIGFRIQDNGIGFDTENYDAFLTSDTTHKLGRGGKGIGRFLWLTAFKKVEVESVFCEENKYYKRKFSFCLSPQGIENYSLEEIVEEERATIVKLIGYDEKYSKNCRKKLESLAILIVEQFLDVFIGSNCPKIILHDSLTGESLDLDDFYEQEMVVNTERKDILIKKNVFNLIFVRLYSTHISEHKINYCANDRVALSEKLTGIPNLIKRFSDDADRAFVCAVYVNSNVLDSAVNQERTDFSMLKDSDGLFEEDISMADIRCAVKDACKEYLNPYTTPIAKKKEEKIEKFIKSDGAMYRPIIKYLKSEIDSITPEATEDEIDRVLYEGYHKFQVSLREESQELIAKANEDDDTQWEEYQNKFIEYFEKLTESNKADLARYVCHRKAVIEFFKKQLALQPDGKYSPEERIHRIIFPLGKTSNDVPFFDHNLWLIDERMAFHAFLSSDKPIKQNEPLENNSKKEPDLLIFDKAAAFSDSNVPFTSITIIEFKRPLRKDYSEKENPFTQVTTYIDEIKAGKAVMHDGRPFDLTGKVPFHCFIICDITDQLKKWAKFFGLHKTPDEMGYFGYNQNYDAYFEVISYTKLIIDAEKRNKAFFHKIGL